ncbi:MAG: peptidoglycan endopeptidase, partial [Syntrophomonadaceae bacterium]|nr:peptidoglycan endopeptidase [Syntrophomonadaceae bacterium]
SIYVVQSGDNLWSISQRYGTTVENIMALNSLSSDRLQIGDQLIVSGTAPAPVASPVVSRSGDSVTGSRIIEKAANYLGTPYVYGGSSPSGFDCSGFTQYIYKQLGISLYRTAASQYGHGVQVSKSQLIAGDLVFFKCGGSTINHVGIYCGNGQFIHSSSPSSGGVIYSSLNSGYYANTYVGARRIVR